MDEKYLSYIRELACSCCGRDGPSEPNHDRRKGTGMALRSPDARAMPFCRPCHRDYHQYRGYFSTLTYEQRCAWADETIALLQEGYRRLYGDEAELRERIEPEVHPDDRARLTEELLSAKRLADQSDSAKSTQ